jgi:hypothetical protein
MLRSSAGRRSKGEFVEFEAVLGLQSVVCDLSNKVKVDLHGIEIFRRLPADQAFRARVHLSAGGWAAGAADVAYVFGGFGAGDGAIAGAVAEGRRHVVRGCTRRVVLVGS